MDPHIPLPPDPRPGVPFDTAVRDAVSGAEIVAFMDASPAPVAQVEEWVTLTAQRLDAALVERFKDRPFSIGAIIDRILRYRLATIDTDGIDAWAVQQVEGPTADDALTGTLFDTLLVLLHTRAIPAAGRTLARLERLVRDPADPLATPARLQGAIHAVAHAATLTPTLITTCLARHPAPEHFDPAALARLVQATDAGDAHWLQVLAWPGLHQTLRFPERAYDSRAVRDALWPRLTPSPIDVTHAMTLLAAAESLEEWRERFATLSTLAPATGVMVFHMATPERRASLTRRDFTALLQSALPEHSKRELLDFLIGLTPARTEDVSDDPLFPPIAEPSPRRMVTAGRRPSPLPST